MLKPLPIRRWASVRHLLDAAAAAASGRSRARRVRRFAVAEGALTHWSTGACTGAARLLCSAASLFAYAPAPEPGVAGATRAVEGLMEDLARQLLCHGEGHETDFQSFRIDGEVLTVESARHCDPRAGACRASSGSS
jgi:hypothetical protein